MHTAHVNRISTMCLALFRAAGAQRLALVLCTGLTLTLGSTAAQAIDYTFTGALTDGPLVGQTLD